MPNSNLFSEYIGAQGVPVGFDEVHINPEVRFHFILAFAVEYDRNADPPGTTHGGFHVFWDQTNLTGRHVAAIKRTHPNVRVALSLGGDTVVGANNVVTNVCFRTSLSRVDSWVTNAFSTLVPIIEEYDLDGIDINYERFEPQASPRVFAKCIGRLITKLKRENKITFASIAPFNDDQVQSHYSFLWNYYRHVIDHVNFQFYAYPRINANQFMKYFYQQSRLYPGGRVLASFSTRRSRRDDPDDTDPGGLWPEGGFVAACQRLRDENRLSGIFVWSADSSRNRNRLNGYDYDYDYDDERQSQQLLENEPSPIYIRLGWWQRMQQCWLCCIGLG